ncbi:MAG: hypothetical protein HKN53_12470 [Maribacter sp.]|nr:hypothetical protein [Maribacter sp.]
MLPFQLASVGDDVFIDISGKGIFLIFFAVTSSGFLVSFLALNLIQKNKIVSRRLIICGDHPIELLVSILLALFMVIAMIAVYVGWVQNPLFYAEAQNQIIIKFLPAYFPSQTAIITAVTDYSSSSATVYGILYGSIFLLFSMLIFFYKMRTK